MQKTPENQIKFIQLLHYLYSVSNAMIAIIFDLFAITLVNSFLSFDKIKAENPDITLESIKIAMLITFSISLYFWIGTLFALVISKKILKKDCYNKIKKLALFECIILPLGPIVGMVTWKFLDKPSIKAYYETAEKSLES